MNQSNLIDAIKRGDNETAIALLASNLDPNLKENDKYGWTALLYAQENHNLDLVEALIAKGADVNLGDSSNRTPLICASRLGDTRIVQSLLDAGADVNAVDSIGWTALNQARHQLCESNGDECYLDIIKLLEQAGASE